MSSRSILPALLSALVLAGAGTAQRTRKDYDTVIRGRTETMEKLGLSYGPFRFAHSDSEAVTFDMLLDGEIHWLETPHFRIGSSLRKWKIPVAERKAYRAELTLMQADYPDIDIKIPALDSWYRLHMAGWRLERLYAEFLAHMGRTDEEFLGLPPEEVIGAAMEGEFTDTINQFELDRGGQVRPEGFPQWVGMGHFLGEPFKFEVFLCEEEAVWKDFKQRYFGITTTHPQRWNMKVDTVDKGVTQARSRCLLFGLSTEQARVKHDQHLHNALRHNMSINFLDGYMLYLFDMPVWIREGYAHYQRRRNTPEYNFYDSGEGSSGIDRDAKKWKPTAKKIARSGKALDFATLARINDYVDLNFDNHLNVWSRIDFLIQYDVKKFGLFITSIKTQPSGAGSAAAQREAFKTVYGWTMRQADQEWKTWVAANY